MRNFVIGQNFASGDEEVFKESHRLHATTEESPLSDLITGDL